MGLVKRASKLLQGVREHKEKFQGPEKAKEEDAKGETRKAGNFLALQKRRQRTAAREVTADKTLKLQKAAAMAQETASAHQTGARSIDAFRKPRKMADAPQTPITEEVEEEEEEHEDDRSDDLYESESETEVDESVVGDMHKLEESFKGISRKYRLINRIGEGTFSTVYKAEQLPPLEDNCPADVPQHERFPQNNDENDPPAKRRKLSPSPPMPAVPKPTVDRKPQYVALKKIYVTSSPYRIQNELEILHTLRSSPHICPLLTAFRHLDQVVAVLPYFRHLDFRLYYKDFFISDMRHYFRSLLSALHSVHRAGILHRDIKPTNFLYDHSKRRGVLVDFGLAEKQGTDWQPCLCLEHRDVRKERYMSSFAFATQQANGTGLSVGYPKNDGRSSRRANRAGTRGFRAPEVLLKCTAQTTKIDIWSTGVILLTLLARRFPFFNSTDDVDAMIEIACIFGKKRMKMCAAMHGSVFETSIETIGERGFSLQRIVLWASCRENEQEPQSKAELQAVALLEGLLELDPHKRLSAKEALNHDFFVRPEIDENEGVRGDEESDGPQG